MRALFLAIVVVMLAAADTHAGDIEKHKLQVGQSSTWGPRARNGLEVIARSADPTIASVEVGGGEPVITGVSPGHTVVMLDYGIPIPRDYPPARGLRVGRRGRILTTKQRWIFVEVVAYEVTSSSTTFDGRIIQLQVLKNGKLLYEFPAEHWSGVSRVRALHPSIATASSKVPLRVEIEGVERGTALFEISATRTSDGEPEKTWLEVEVVDPLFLRANFGGSGVDLTGPPDVFVTVEAGSSVEQPVKLEWAGTRVARSDLFTVKNPSVAQVTDVRYRYDRQQRPTGLRSVTIHGSKVDRTDATLLYWATNHQNRRERDEFRIRIEVTQRLGANSTAGESHETPGVGTGRAGIADLVAVREGLAVHGRVRYTPPPAPVSGGAGAAPPPMDGSSRKDRLRYDAPGFGPLRTPTRSAGAASAPPSVPPAAPPAAPPAPAAPWRLPSTPAPSQERSEPAVEPDPFPARGLGTGGEPLGVPLPRTAPRSVRGPVPVLPEAQRQ
jgi:hypothetical protein